MALSQMFRAAHSSFSAAVSGEVRLALEAAEIPTFWRSFHEMQCELRRCRRYEHPLSVLAVGVDGSRLQQSEPPKELAGADSNALLRRFGCTAVLILGWILRDGTRESDQLCYAAEHDLYVVLLPETNACGAHDAAMRLSHVYEERSALGLRVGSATFPEHGFTLEGLFEQARTSLAPLPRVTRLEEAPGAPTIAPAGPAIAPTSSSIAAASAITPAGSTIAPATLKRVDEPRIEQMVRRARNG